MSDITALLGFIRQSKQIRCSVSCCWLCNRFRLTVFRFGIVIRFLLHLASASTRPFRRPLSVGSLRAIVLELSPACLSDLLKTLESPCLHAMKVRYNRRVIRNDGRRSRSLIDEFPIAWPFSRRLRGLF